MLVTNCRKSRNLAGQQPKQVVGNKSKPATSLNSARQQQQIATHQQQKSSAQQYRVVGQQGTRAKIPQNSHLNIPTRLNKQKGTVNLQDSAVAIPGLLQKHQKDTIEMVKRTVKMQDSTVEMQDHTIKMRDNTVEVRDSSVEMQGMVQTKQTGTVEMRGSAVAMQGLLQNKQKADCSMQNDNKEVKKAVDFQDSRVQNVVLNAAIENPFVVLDLYIEESDVKPVTNPLILTSLANKKKLKFPLQKFLSPKANTQKGRERISKKHWKRELANFRECVTPASDGKMIKRRRENRGDTVREGSSPPLNSHPSSSPPMIKAIFWNCRGVKKPASRNHLQALVREHSPVVICLLETRVQSFFKREVDRLVGRHWDFHVEPSVGKSGGIIMCWLNHTAQLQVIHSNKQVVLAQAIVMGQHIWHICAVYADKDYIKR
ncbi:hypothetical protein AXF42_Ash007013 [Apostasia shenzhenica]|uniref:Endonuclease/exonuclease/phosphatase domain-containing protein n=1 Tax=Apostasia shenzhenica TaxID=1088818 RepID=A0A2I0BEX4_9ASPA|nr:hypothetical protein AXF42_Ash007013 [Apostasia shenzhenica]